MIVKRLKLQEGFITVDDVFGKFNLIFSKMNSVGKSTYLRILFYALGYAVPTMKGLDYSNIYTEITIIERNKEFILNRSLSTMSVTVVGEDTNLLFSLPQEHNAMLGYLFGNDKVKVLNNLLGIMYVDQEKGWTLLNRGTVIGKIKFSIEELLAGLANIDCDELISKKRILKEEETKYSAMININELSEEVYANNGDIFIADAEKEMTAALSLIELKIRDIKESIKNIDDSIRQEESFWKFIDSMCLSIKHEDQIIDVNRDNIIYSSESVEYLKARKNILSANMQDLVNEKAKLRNQLDDYYTKNTELTSFYGDTQETLINRQLSTFHFDKDTINKLLEKVQAELKRVNKELKRILKTNNSIIQMVYNYVKKYATILKIDDKINAKKDYIFTSDLKSFSGANLQKLVFAFKVAFLKVIEEVLGVKLIFVLDSPRGKELDEDNLKLIMSIVESDLKENQIFVASIYDDFSYTNKIEIRDRAIESRL